MPLGASRRHLILPKSMHHVCWRPEQQSIEYHCTWTLSSQSLQRWRDNSGNQCGCEVYTSQPYHSNERCRLHLEFGYKTKHSEIDHSFLKCWPPCKKISCLPLIGPSSPSRIPRNCPCPCRMRWPGFVWSSILMRHDSTTTSLIAEECEGFWGRFKDPLIAEHDCYGDGFDGLVLGPLWLHDSPLHGARDHVRCQIQRWIHWLLCDSSQWQLPRIS